MHEFVVRPPDVATPASTAARRPPPVVVGPHDDRHERDADAIADQQSQVPAGLVPFHHQSYIVRVQLEEADVVRKIGDFNPTPGMPADLYIKTGERTLFEYMLRPVLDSFSRAFREH